MRYLIVELEDSVKQFKDCEFILNKETGCFEVYHINSIYYYRTVVGMFPKEHVIAIYHRYKENEE